MADILTPEQRFRCMSAIRGKNTKPEMVIRRMMHAMGFRYRLHRTDLPGKPDIVCPGLRKIILVHGCFWHMHRCRYGRVTPKTNAAFWSQKRQANKERDRLVMRCLRRQGWDVLVIWECQVGSEGLPGRIHRFLQLPPRASA